MPESARPNPTPAQMMAENIRRLKQERGVSLSEIARHAEIHHTHVSLILRGKRMVQIDTIVKVVGALEAEPADLLRGIVWVPADRAGRYVRAWDGRFARREPQPPCECFGRGSITLSRGIEGHPRASPGMRLDFLRTSSYVLSMPFFQASIATTRRPEIRRGLRCPGLPDLAGRPDPDWQAASRQFSHGRARSRPLPRARLSTHSARGPIAAGRSPSRVSRRTPARAAPPSAPRYRLRAGYAAALRLGGRDHARRDRDRLGAGDTAAPLIRAGRSGSAPYRRAGLAAIGGGGDGAAARRLPTASASVRQEAA